MYMGHKSLGVAAPVLQFLGRGMCKALAGLDATISYGNFGLAPGLPDCAGIEISWWLTFLLVDVFERNRKLQQLTFPSVSWWDFIQASTMLKVCETCSNATHFSFECP